MFIQIKAIRKKTKPTVWRRAYVPLGITFSQMAYILEVMLELPVTDQYEFEFFQEKDRLVERDMPDFKKNSPQFRYRNAVKASIDDWSKSKTWFTFRVAGDNEGFPQYRVEIENKVDIFIGESAEKEKEVPLAFPLLAKQSSYEGETSWTDPKEISQKLEDSCHITEGKAEYPSFASVCERVERGEGIVICPDLKSLDNIIKESAHDIIMNLWNQIEELQDSMPDKGGSLQEALQDSMSAQTDNDSMPKPETKAKPYNYKVKQLKSVEEILKRYSKEGLEQIAEEYGCQLHSTTKGKMAFELACLIMEPKFMKAQLLDFDEAELDSFEAAIKAGTFYPDDDERYNLDRFLNLNYIARFNSGQFQVPEDAAIVYTNLCRHGYREFHKKARWLMNCLETFSHLYLVGNTNLLYKLYCQSKKIKSDRKEFDSILSQIPDDINACRKIGNRIVAEDISEDGFYKKIESMQQDVPYYIPSEREIKDYADLGYPVSDPAYQNLFNFFLVDMDQHPLDCEEYCMEAFYTFSIGKMLTDYAEFLNTRDVVFNSKRQVEKFTNLAMEVINNTRQFQFKGHTPNEMSVLYSKGMKGRMEFEPLTAPNSWMNAQTAAPINGTAGQTGSPISGTTGQTTALINGAIGQTEAPNSRKNMQTGARKIYPNDPCPCGSGKKYKKCCGRNR